MKNNLSLSGRSSLRSALGSASNISGLSNSSRAPKANMSNARELMGDVVDDPFGDPSFVGDPSFLGDVAVDAPFGDVSDYGDIQPDSYALGAYDTIIGDVSDYETGELVSKVRNRYRALPRAARYGITGAAAVGAGYGLYKGGKAIVNAIKQRQDRKRRLAAAQRASMASTNSSAQLYAQRNLAKVSPRQPMAFYQVMGASVSNYPMPPNKTFPMKSLTWSLDQMSNNTPYVAYVQKATQAAPGADYVATVVGTALGQYYCGLFIIIGGNILQTAPGTNFDVTGTFPLVQGQTLVVNAANKWTFTLGNKFYCKIGIFPWTVQALEPQYTSGYFSAANNIIVTVSNAIPDGASVSVVVPGSLHPWVRGLRNAGI